MTYPTSQQGYTSGSGSAKIAAPIIVNRDPGQYDVGYKIQQYWVNSNTNAIWVLETLSSSGGTVKALWRALAPIVLLGRDPTTSDYEYPVGQTWVNTATTSYWVLVEVSGTTATWDQLTSATSIGVLTLSDSASVTVDPDASGNIQFPAGNNITAVAGTNTLTLNVSGTTAHSVLLGNSSGSLTNLSPSASSGIPLVSQGASTNPAFTTATVGGGGTGKTTFNAYAVVCAGTTGTGVFQDSGTPGAAGTILTSTGSTSVPSWQSFPSAAVKVVNQVFTTTGTYTPTVGMLYASIQVLGGGGAGGGSNNASMGNYSAGGGGGAGEYAVGIFAASSIGASKAVTIGAAGTGSSASTGGSGGTSSVGILITAVGGSGGTAGTASAASTAAGGLGGTGGTGGDYRTPGTAGTIGFYSVAASTTVAGAGASSQLGAGGNVPIYAGGAAGNAALGYGAGGAGSSSNSGTTGSFAGGNGTAGIVVITEYL